MESQVVRALHDLPEFPGFFITRVRGQGRGRGAGGAYLSTEVDLSYHEFIKLEIVCDAAAVEINLLENCRCGLDGSQRRWRCVLRSRPQLWTHPRTWCASA